MPDRRIYEIYELRDSLYKPLPYQGFVGRIEANKKDTILAWILRFFRKKKKRSD